MEEHKKNVETILQIREETIRKINIANEAFKAIPQIMKEKKEQENPTIRNAKLGSSLESHQ